MRTLTRRELNRALLARQLLLERGRMPLPRALERVGGIQAQYAPEAGQRAGDGRRGAHAARAAGRRGQHREQGSLRFVTVSFTLFLFGPGQSQRRRALTIGEAGARRRPVGGGGLPRLDVWLVTRHAGAGGSVHAAWPQERVGLSYAMSQLRDEPAGVPRSQALLGALYEAVQARAADRLGATGERP